MAPNGDPTTRRKPRIALLLVLAVYTTLLGTLPLFWNPNEMSHLLLTVSLSDRGSVRINPEISRYGVAPEDMAVRDGYSYSDKAPGLSMVAVIPAVLIVPFLPRFNDGKAPDYWAMRHLLTWMVVSLPLVLILFAPATSRLLAPTGPRMDGIAIATVLALATPLLTYGSLFFSHVPATLLVGSAYYLARGVTGRTARADAVRAAGAGALASFAVATEYPTAILFLAVFAMLLVRRRDRIAVIAFGCGALLGGVPLAMYNFAAWGTVFTTGYAFKASAQQAAIHSRGFFGVTMPTANQLFGVLLSARRGVLFYCPLLACVVVGWARGWRESRAETVVSMVFSTAYVFFAAGFVDWQGGWSAADRHLLPVLAVVVIPWARGVRVLLDRTWGTALVGTLAGWSLVASLLSVAVMPYFPEPFSNPLAQIAISTLREGIAFRNLISDHSGIAPIVVFGVVATLAILAVGVSLASLTTQRLHRAVVGVTFLLTVALTPLALLSMNGASGPREELLRAGLLERMGETDAARSVAERAAGR